MAKDDDDTLDPRKTLEDILARVSERLSGGGIERDCSPRSGKLSLQEKVDRLRHGQALLETGKAADFKIGMLVVGKKELVASHIQSWEMPHLILEFLDPPLRPVFNEEGAGSNGAAKCYNAVIGSLAGKNDDFIRHLADLREWEIWPDTKKYTKDS